MNASELLNKAKELLSVEVQAEEVKLAQANLENGTVIEAESFEAGQEIFIVTEDEKVALPVGEYRLEDGQVLVVEEEGIIASVGAQEEEEVEAEEVTEELAEEQELAEEEEMGYATKEELAEVKSMIEDIKAMIEKKEEMSAEVQAEEAVEEIVEEVKEELSQIEKVKHNPEANTRKRNNLYAQKRTLSTFDLVLSKIANKK